MVAEPTKRSWPNTLAKTSGTRKFGNMTKFYMVENGRELATIPLRNLLPCIVTVSSVSPRHLNTLHFNCPMDTPVSDICFLLSTQLMHDCVLQLRKWSVTIRIRQMECDIILNVPLLH